MSGAGLADVFQIGPRVTAQILGQPFTQYRATTATSPLATPFATLPAWITGDPKLMASAPFAYAKPVGYAAVDPALTKVGDYLVGARVPGGPVETFFIASQDVPEPIQVVQCNRMLSFTRSATESQVGLNPGYGGATQATDTPLLTGWPASCLLGTKGDAVPAGVRLPGDARAPWWNVMLPAFPGVVLNMGDHATDDIGRTYTVSSAELTNMGWRLLVALAST